MFFIDIAVPRDVDPALNEVEGCFVYDIDDLQQVTSATSPVAHARPRPPKPSSRNEVEQYQQRLIDAPAFEAIKALQQSAELIRQAELARSAEKLSGLTEDQKAAVEALTRSLIGKLLHPQIAGLRAATVSATTKTPERSSRNL